MVSRIRKLIMAGLIIGVTASSSFACYIQNSAPYEIDGAGTMTVFLGHVSFSGSENSGNVTAVGVKHWIGGKLCPANWNGTYTQSTDAIGGFQYEATVTVTNQDGSDSGCFEKGKTLNLEIEPSNAGENIHFIVTNPNSLIHGSGELQN